MQFMRKYRLASLAYYPEVHCSAVEDHLIAGQKWIAPLCCEVWQRRQGSPCAVGQEQPAASCQTAATDTERYRIVRVTVLLHC